MFMHESMIRFKGFAFAWTRIYIGTQMFSFFKFISSGGQYFYVYTPSNVLYPWGSFSQSYPSQVES